MSFAPSTFPLVESRPLLGRILVDFRTSSRRRLSSRPHLLGVGRTLPLYLSFDCVCDLWIMCTFPLTSGCVIGNCWSDCILVFIFVFLLFLPFSPSKCENIHLRVLPYIILVSCAMLIHILESLSSTF